MGQPSTRDDSVAMLATFCALEIRVIIWTLNGPTMEIGDPDLKAAILIYFPREQHYHALPPIGRVN